jgi:hypothetical protein
VVQLGSNIRTDTADNGKTIKRNSGVLITQYCGQQYGLAYGSAPGTNASGSQTIRNMRRIYSRRCRNLITIPDKDKTGTNGLSQPCIAHIQ